MDNLTSKQKSLMLAQTLKQSGEAYSTIGFLPGVATSVVMAEALTYSDVTVMNTVLSKLTQFSITLLREMGKTELADLLESAE